MKHIVTAAALGLLAAAAASTSQAQDWTGAYIGAQAGGVSQRDRGGQSVNFDTNLDGAFSDRVNNAAGANAFGPGFCNGATYSSTPGSCADKDDTEFEFGGRAGYDWQFGGFVVGVVGEATRMRVQDSVTAFSTTPASYTMTRELKGVLAARARAGYALGRTLAYATGGYAWADVDHGFSTTNTANTFTKTENDDRVDGWQVGGGIEHKLTDNVSMGLEYLQTNLQDDGFRVRASGPAGGPFTTANSSGTDFARSEDDLKVHSVRLTAAYRF